MTFKIEAGVPMTVSGRGRRSSVEFPLHQMDVGDSFLIPCDPKNKKELDSWRRKLLAQKKRMKGGKWATAVVSGGLRVWRTA
jgi:hypothetical protein